MGLSACGEVIVRLWSGLFLMLLFNSQRTNSGKGFYVLMVPNRKFFSKIVIKFYDAKIKINFNKITGWDSMKESRALKSACFAI